MLWEIGDDGVDVRALRRRLDLDSGYVSRLLRQLERDGPIAVERACEDGRTEAIALYRSTGYVEVEPFNDEPYANHWFEKRLG